MYPEILGLYIEQACTIISGGSYTNNEKFMLKLSQYPEPITPSGN